MKNYWIVLSLCLSMCLYTSWKLYAQNNNIVATKGRIIDEQGKGI